MTLLSEVEVVPRWRIMGPARWTLTQLLILIFFHLGYQIVAPTTNLHREDASNVVSHSLHPAVDISTVAPEWVQNNETSSLDYSQEDGQGLLGPTNETSTLDSEQLLVDMLLHDKARAWTSSLPAASPPVQTPTNESWTEISSGGSPSVPLVTTSQLTTSGWPKMPSQFPALFMTTAHFTVTPNREESLGTDTSPFGAFSAVEGSSTTPTTTVGNYSSSVFFTPDSAAPSEWTSPEDSTNETQLLEKDPSTLSSLGPFTPVDILGDSLSTEETPNPSGTISGGFLVVSEEDEWLSGPKSEETSISPSTEAVTSDAAPGSPAYYSDDDDSTFLGCSHLNDENCDFSITPSPTSKELQPTVSGQSSLLPSPPIFITLHSDWNTSVADWGIAWEALVYGSVGLFGLVVLFALLSLICLIFRCPSGSAYFAVLHLLLISVGSSRAFALFYDAYGHQDKLPVFTSVLLYDLAFPCMTSSFSIVFLLLSSRCRLQHKSPCFPRLCLLAVAAFLHFIFSAGAVVVVDLLQQFPFLLLVSRGFYVVLAVFLSLAFFVFYCVARTQNTQIYDLKTSAPPTEYTGGCPFADSKDWNRATHTVLISASFGLLNCGLQLYAILHAMGYGGPIVFGPWPWWAFQLSSSLCEMGICLPLALVGAYPLFCSNEMGRTNCWSKLFRISPGHVTMKAPILPTNHQWASSQHEKLLICDTIVRSDSEFFPLYTLVEKRLSLGEDLSLIYHSNKSMEVQGLSLHDVTKTPSFISVQMDSDSTVDFRPPSPINLRRSIDEALFSESLIPKSLFHGTALSSSVSLTIRSATQLEDCIFKEKAADRGLYRTSSCVEMETTAVPVVEPTPNTTRQDTTTSTSPGIWRGEQSTASSLYKVSLDGSSLVLCSSPEHGISYSFESKPEFTSHSQGAYQTLSPPSQESLDVPGQPGSSLRDDFIDVFGPIDALSVGSDTIDL